jgi:hypothetical protein
LRSTVRDVIEIDPDLKLTSPKANKADGPVEKIKEDQHKNTKASKNYF